MGEMLKMVIDRIRDWRRALRRALARHIEHPAGDGERRIRIYPEYTGTAEYGAQGGREVQRGDVPAAGRTMEEISYALLVCTDQRYLGIAARRAVGRYDSHTYSICDAQHRLTFGASTISTSGGRLSCAMCRIRAFFLRADG